MRMTFDDNYTRRPGKYDIADLPRGVIAPPAHLVEMMNKERKKFAPEIFTDCYAKSTLDDWTLHYYFADQYIAFRSVPDGVEVLAVGLDEVGDYIKGKNQEELLSFKCTVP